MSKASPALEPVSSEAAAPTLRGQVREWLRRQIHGGRWLTGDQLPSEAELMAQHRVSRITVRHALADLAAEGLIERLQGKGSFVAPATIVQDLSRLQGLSEALSYQGRAVRTEVLSLRPHRPAAAIGQVLGLQGAATCLLLHTVRYADEHPISENHTWIHPAVAPSLKASDLEQADLLTLYESRLGLRLARANVDIQADLATSAQCKRLELKAPSAILRLERTVYSATEQAVHHERSICHPSALSYRLNLAR
jgi:DNA-binding GntR family transcriptional regulator